MIHKCSEEELYEGDSGRCDACGAVANGVEPDARNYVCDECGAREVYGLEELLMMGQIELT
jgi:hypothetical protein